MEVHGTSALRAGTLLCLTLLWAGPTLAADYEVTFEAFWNAADHPTGFPPNAHFSSLIGASHNANDSYWVVGEAASPEIVEVAENGNRTPLSNLIDASPNVLDKIVAPGIFSPGATAALAFSVDANHPLVSLASMVAPSPDWFVGVHDLDLRDGIGFVESLVVDLIPYDAGTEEGTGFSFNNPPSPPGGVIGPADQAAIFGGTSPIARLTFIRTSAPAGAIFEDRPANSNDDAEEHSDASVDVTSPDLQLTTDGTDIQLVGIRIDSVVLGQTRVVRDAWIQFQSDGASLAPTFLEIRAEFTDDADPFSTSVADLSSRLRTAASVGWQVPAWLSGGAQGPAQRTPNLAALINEVVDDPAWVSGGAMVFLFEGTGVRTAESFDGDPAAAPQLHILASTPTQSCGLGPEVALLLAGWPAMRRWRNRGSDTAGAAD